MTSPVGRSSCTSILIGKKATVDNSVIIGRNEDAKTAWPKHLAFNQHQIKKHNIFKSKDNKFEITLQTSVFLILPLLNGQINMVYLKKMESMNIM